MSNPFDGATPLGLNPDSTAEDVRKYEGYAAIAVLRLQAARMIPYQLTPTATVRDSAGKIQCVTLTSAANMAVRVTY